LKSVLEKNFAQVILKNYLFSCDITVYSYFSFIPSLFKAERIKFRQNEFYHITDVETA